MISYDDLLQVCARYSAQNYYVGDLIPAQKLANARKRYPIPQQERVVALLDVTVFGSAKAGLAVGETGLHWRNANTETKRTYMSWRELAEVPIVAKGVVSARVEMGQDATIELAGSVMGKDDVVRLLSDIQHLIRSPSTVNKSRSITGTKEQWMLAVNGRQYGPYDLPTVRSMMAKGQINPSECLAWKAGMANWERFTQIPTLAALVRNVPRPPAMPPPLPTSAAPAPADPGTTDEAPRDHVRPILRNGTVSYEDLLRVCVKYNGNGYYVGETIPQKKLTNARSSFSIPDTERVVALLDTTVFGSNKDGLAVCTGGVYWHDVLSDPKRLLWAEFASADVKAKGKRELEIGEDNAFQPTGAMDRDDALRLLLEIQVLIRSSLTGSGAASGPTSARVLEAEEADSARRTGARPPTTQVPTLLDLNHAPAEDLLALPAMSLSNSQKLIEERERRDGFDTVEEAGHLLGLQPHQVERLKQRVTLEPYTSVRPGGGRVVDF